MNYKHTQIGHLMISILFIIILFFYFIIKRKLSLLPLEEAYFTDFIILIIIFIVASFITLQVIIDEKYIRVKFGYGIFSKKLLLKEIISAKQVKNKWYYGWGIRYWFWKKMTIYNVSGFDAVEIKMKNGNIYRIGTDEPENLEYAIIQSINN
jgi:hypothetical protein